jgi:RNA polymerase sigma factor (sigma-70 family)
MQFAWSSETVMAAQVKSLLRIVQEMAVPPGLDVGSDAVLVDRFLAQRDGRAFSAIVNRHGAMVLSVCSRILRNREDAEDALQATFLVLAKRAQTLRARDSLAGWLHGVARRVSLKARALRARRTCVEMSAQLPPARSPDPMEELSCRELLKIFDQEVERLPEKQRLAIVLCCLEGLSLEEAAGRLGWETGAVKGRLQRGRHRLHERLVRRGLTLSAALAAVEASLGAASSAVVARLANAFGADDLVRATPAGTPAQGISTGAAALARSVLRASALSRLIVAAGCLLSLCLVALAFAARSIQPPSTTANPDFAPLQVAATRVDRDRAEAVDDDDIPIEVKGRVLDPAGRPFGGASLYVGYTASDNRFERSSLQNELPLRAKSGEDGGFHFTFTLSELDAMMKDESRPAVIAVASGYGPEWSEVIRRRQPEMVTLKLLEDFPINGRVLDFKGKPVAGAKVRVLNIDSDTEENVTRSLAGLGTPVNHFRRWRGAFPERPQEVTAGADGRFRLSGLGRDRIARLFLDEPFDAHVTIDAVARPSESIRPALYGATFDVTTPETRLVRGICRDRVSGRPVAGVKISARYSRSKPLPTDANGRFEIRVAVEEKGSNCIIAEPQDGQPYFAASALVPKAAGSDTTTLEFDLLQGIRVEGRVHAPPATKPPGAGRVEYYPLHTNGHAAKIQTWAFIPASSGPIQPDGSFQLVVLPGPGAVAVDASPRRSFAAASVDDQELAAFFRDGKRHQDERGIYCRVGTRSAGFSPKKYNAVALINPDDKAQSLSLNVELRQGVRLQGLVLDPEYQPFSGARIIGLAHGDLSERIDGPFFEITELGPQSVREVLFIQKEKRLAKFLTVQADEAGSLQVRLEACGTLAGRMVDKCGRPIPNTVIVWSTRSFRLDPEVFCTSTDQRGRFEMLIVPRMRYSSSPRLFFAGTRKLLEDISLEPGQTQELGDLSYDAGGPKVK